MQEFSADRIQKQVEAKLYLIGRAAAQTMETDAKKNAPWTDRTTNARNALYGDVVREKESVLVILGHGVDYGIYLENRHAFKYAILMPTLLKHYNTIMKGVAGIFK